MEKDFDNFMKGYVMSMRFINEQLLEGDFFPHGDYYLDGDNSLVYTAIDGSYEIFLSDSWTHYLDADYNTGRCFSLTIQFLDKVPLFETELALPNSIRGKLIFKGENPLERASGCHYIPYKTETYIDTKKSYMCW